jgi:polysaccharide deacetylase family sporulation protein PdaB
MRDGTRDARSGFIWNLGLGGGASAAPWKTTPYAAGQLPAPRWIAILALVILSVVYATIAPGADVSAIARKRELPVYNVAADDKVIAVSFDAAWGSANTMALLDLLDDRGIKTTFFVVGIWVEKYPELIAEIARRGHEVESHSTTHPHMPQLSDDNMRRELATVASQIEAITGVRPKLFRPPYGDYNDRTILVARQEGYEVVQWNVDSLDWKNLGAQPMIDAATKKLAPGDIVLFHNDSKYLMDALPTILDYYISNGYRVIPVSQILLSGDTYIDHAGTQHLKAKTAPAPDA